MNPGDPKPMQYLQRSNCQRCNSASTTACLMGKRWDRWCRDRKHRWNDPEDYVIQIAANHQCSMCRDTGKVFQAYGEKYVPCPACYPAIDVANP